MSAEPQRVELTEAEQTTLITALLDPDFDCAHNFGPLFREVARMVAAARREALLEAADEMDNTDDPDAIYVDNGDIDLWLRARAERIQGIEADAYIADERDKEGGND